MTSHKKSTIYIVLLISLYISSCSNSISEEKYIDWYINGRIIEEYYKYNKDSLEIHKQLLMDSLAINLEQLQRFQELNKENVELWIRVREEASERFKKMMKQENRK